MIRRLKTWVKRRWPAVRLRVILFGVLLFTAAMPGVGAVFLRVYENSLVRQTEAELVAQGAVLEAAFRQAWPEPHGAKDGPKAAVDRSAVSLYEPEALTIDLNAMEILPERPAGVPAGPADPRAVAAATAIEAITRETTRDTLASIRITDAAGIVVLGNQDKGKSYAAIPEVAAALQGIPQTVIRRRGDYVPRYAFEVLSRASAIRVHYVRPIRIEDRIAGTLVLSRSPRALFRGIYDDLGKIALGIGIIFVVILGLAAILSRAIARPIEQLTEATAHVARGQMLVPETPATATVEIRSLFDNFRDMAATIDRRARYLRDFAAAINHEFKTPLAGIRGALELLEDHGETMSPDERRRFLDNARADADRLTHLVARLLELARADLSPGSGDGGSAIGPPLRRIADAMRSDRFAVTLDLPAGMPDVALPAQVLESVVATLVENARQAGALLVTISAEVRSDFVCLIVQDDGPGVPEGDRDRLFEPFFTTRRAEGGTGLGLPIAVSLLAATGSRILLASSDGGARFVVELRRAAVAPPASA